jgi:hypothetical protein
MTEKSEDAAPYQTGSFASYILYILSGALPEKAKPDPGGTRSRRFRSSDGEIETHLNRAEGLVFDASLRQLRPDDNPDEHERAASFRWLFNLHRRQIRIWELAREESPEIARSAVVNPRLDAFFAKVDRRIAESTDPSAKQCELMGEPERKRGRGRPVEYEDRDLEIATAVEFRIHRQDKTWEVAINEVADKFKLSFDSVAKIHKAALKKYPRGLLNP